MTTPRTAFKFFGSFGPAGAIAVLSEKIARAVWNDAYEQGDPNNEPAAKFVE